MKKLSFSFWIFVLVGLGLVISNTHAGYKKITFHKISAASVFAWSDGCPTKVESFKLLNNPTVYVFYGDVKTMGALSGFTMLIDEVKVRPGYDICQSTKVVTEVVLVQDCFDVKFATKACDGWIVNIDDPIRLKIKQTFYGNRWAGDALKPVYSRTLEVVGKLNASSPCVFGYYLKFSIPELKKTNVLDAYKPLTEYGIDMRPLEPMKIYVGPTPVPSISPCN